MKIAIITVNYNGKQDTLDFLESLKKLDTKDFETKIVVVDNGSTDGSVSEIQKKFPHVTVLQTGENKGFTGGFNHGLRYSKIWDADYHLIINNDVLINSKDLLEKLVKTAQSEEKIGIVAPKILFAPGFEFHKDRYSKEDVGKVIWYAGGTFDWDNIMSSHRGIDEVDKEQFDKVEQVDYITGCCLLFKNEVLEKVGMFDESLFSYMEDADLSVRIKKSGFKKYYNGTVSIYHKVSQTAGLGSPYTDYYLTRNRLIFGFRYTKFRTKFALVREAVKFLLFGRPKQKSAVLDFFFGGKNGAPSAGRFVEGEVEFPYKLSVVILNYNTAELVKNELDSIFKKNSGFDKQTTEVIVMDNGRLDPVDKIIKDYPKAQYLQVPENLGFTKGYNRLIHYSGGKYILLLNSDIEIMENGLAEMVKWADHYKGEAVLGGRLYFPDMSDQDSVFKLPTLWGAIKEYFFKVKGAYFMYLPKVEKPLKVEGLVMACYLIPRKILNKVGYLDEKTFIFFEDIEYCRRLKQNGVPIYFIPTAKFIHHHGASTKKTDDAYEKLVKGSLNYHGRFYYSLLYFVLLLGQKFGRVKTPVARPAK